MNQFIYLYNNFFKYTNKNKFFEVFDRISNTEIIYNISIESTINIWLKNTKLVGDFSVYSGKLFTLLSEKETSEEANILLLN